MTQDVEHWCTKHFFWCSLNLDVHEDHHFHPTMVVHFCGCCLLSARTLGRRSTASMGETYERRWEVKVVNFQPPLSMVVSATENVRDFPL